MIAVRNSQTVPNAKPRLSARSIFCCLLAQKYVARQAEAARCAASYAAGYRSFFFFGRHGGGGGRSRALPWIRYCSCCKEASKGFQSLHFLASNQGCGKTEVEQVQLATSQCQIESRLVPFEGLSLLTRVIRTVRRQKPSSTFYASINILISYLLTQSTTSAKKPLSNCSD